MTPPADRKPLVYACAGCSFAGRLAYEVALELDARGTAEMSCLAGVAAKHPHFLRQLEGREAWIIDGCAIGCAQGVFAQVGRPAERQIRLDELGIRKHRPPDGGVAVADVIDLAV
jgi:uncharacterized metal-binding protein